MTHSVAILCIIICGRMQCHIDVYVDMLFLVPDDALGFTMKRLVDLRNKVQKVEMKLRENENERDETIASMANEGVGRFKWG